MESWIVSVVIAVVTLVAGYAGMKNNVQKGMEADKKQDLKIEALEKFMNEKKPLLDHLSRVEEAFGKKIDFQGKELIELKTKLANVPTMKEVRDEFVSKEMYMQMQKHIDEKFDTMGNGLSEILQEVRSRQ